MFISLESFLHTWKTESAATEKILDRLTDAALAQAISMKERNLGRVAWHLVTTIPEMMSRTGLTFEGINEDMPVPTSAKVIADHYREVSKNMIKAVKEHWNDETLMEDREMYGEHWTVAKTLEGLVFHQIHHRGQLTVLMRQAGLTVPGIYGPAREDWHSMFGMEPPVV